MDSVPWLAIGSREGVAEYLLHEVRTPFFLHSGQVAVPLATAREIRVFDIRGQFLRVLGAAGEGPGEFRSLGQAWAVDDTIEAFDSGLMRVTRFVPGGGVEVVRLDLGPVGYGLDSAVPGRLGAGWVLKGVRSFEPGRRDEWGVARFSLDGRFEKELLRIEGLHREGRGGLNPLSPMAFLAIGEAGLYAGETLNPEVQVLDASGTRTHAIRWEVPARSASAEFERAVTLAVERASPDRRERLHSTLRSMSVPQRVPAFAMFLVDSEGRIWVQDYRTERHSGVLGGLTRSGWSGGLWRVLEADGSQIGVVQMPPGFLPYQITDENVLGVRTDSMGVEFVEAYRLGR